MAASEAASSRCSSSGAATAYVVVRKPAVYCPALQLSSTTVPYLLGVARFAAKEYIVALLLLLLCYGLRGHDDKLATVG